MMLFRIEVVLSKNPICTNKFKRRGAIFVREPKASIRRNKFTFDKQANGKVFLGTTEGISHRPELFRYKIYLARLTLSGSSIVRRVLVVR